MLLPLPLVQPLPKFKLMEKTILWCSSHPHSYLPKLIMTFTTESCLLLSKHFDTGTIISWVPTIKSPFLLIITIYPISNPPIRLQADKHDGWKHCLNMITSYNMCLAI